MAPDSSSHDLERRRHAVWALLRSCAIALLVLAAYFALPMTATAALDGLVTLVGGLLVVTVVLVWHVRLILVAPYPAVRALSTLIVTVPLFLVVFSSLYFLMGQADATQWSERLTRLDALYYTVTVFATVGFGDITAESQVARAVTTLQMVLGLTLVGIIARVVIGAVQVNWRRQARD